MTLNRWKILACSLTIGVGGLAVFATPPAGDKTESPKEPAPLPTSVKPAVPPTGLDTSVPVVPVKAEEIELPPLPTPKSEGKQNPSSEPVFEPIAPPAPLILKAGAEEVKPPTKPDDKVPPAVVPAVPMIDLPPVKPIAPPAAPKTETPPPPVIDLDIPIPTVPKPGSPTSAPKPEVVTPPAPPASPKPESFPPGAPPLTGPDPVPPSSLPMATGPAPEAVKPATPPLKNAESAKLKMLLRMGDGQPRFEIRNTATTDLLLKVYGEKIEMQAPPESRSSVAGVTAIGRVRFTAPGIEGSCDHLTILSGTGEVLLKGNIRMKTKSGKAWSELTAEKMVYQIGRVGTLDAIEAASDAGELYSGLI